MPGYSLKDSLSMKRKIFSTISFIIGSIILSAIGSALWSYIQNGSFDLGDFLITSTQIPVSTLFLSLIIVILLIYFYLRTRSEKTELLKSIIINDEKYKNELKNIETSTTKLKNEISRLHSILDEYESIENNVLAILTEKRYGTIDEITRDIQSIKGNISKEQIFNAISHLQSLPNPKIRAHSVYGLERV